eukprot:10004775-Prorocentrum_lima.AAC.1
MKRYRKVQDLLLKRNLHPTNQGSNQGGLHPKPGLIKAKLAQPVEGNLDWNKMTKDQIMAAL